MNVKLQVKAAHTIFVVVCQVDCFTWFELDLLMAEFDEIEGTGARKQER